MTEAMLRTHEQEIRIMDAAALDEMRRRIGIAKLPPAQRQRLYEACDARERELERRRDALVEFGEVEAE
jgi:hypothetical protein